MQLVQQCKPNSFLTIRLAIIKNTGRAVKMAQQGKALATKPDTPSWIPRKHLVKREN